MIEKELVIPVKELARAEVVCQREGCGGSLTVDLSKNDHPYSKCPMCEQQLGGAVWAMAKAWQEFYGHAVKAGVQFRVKQV